MKAQQGQPYLGIVTKVAFQYWRKLPMQVAASLDLDDMVCEILLKLVLVCGRYDSRRGAPSTYVWRVAENHCRVYVNRVLCKKRFSNNWVPWPQAVNAAAPDSGIRFLEAKRGVERMLEFASQDLRRAIATFMVTRKYHRWKPALVSEARKLARQHHVSYNDFLLVLMEV